MLDSRPTFPTSNTVDRRSKWQRPSLNRAPSGLIAQRAPRILINSPTHPVHISQKEKALASKTRAFLCLKIGDPPRGRTGNLLIKSYSVNVFRRVIQCCIVLQLNLRTPKNTHHHAVNRGKLGTKLHPDIARLGSRARKARGRLY